MTLVLHKASRESRRGGGSVEAEACWAAVRGGVCGGATEWAETLRLVVAVGSECGGRARAVLASRFMRLVVMWACAAPPSRVQPRHRPHRHVFRASKPSRIE